MNGDFNEILVYDRALTSDERIVVTQYLISQIPEPYGMTLAGIGGMIFLWRRRG